MGRLYKLVEEIKMSKLPDINYALMAQLSYLHWNNIESKKRITQISMIIHIITLVMKQ